MYLQSWLRLSVVLGVLIACAVLPVTKQATYAATVQAQNVELSAVQTFADAKKSASVRLHAVANIQQLASDQSISVARSVLADRKSPAPVRIRALELVHYALVTNTEFRSGLVRIFTDTSEAPELRLISARVLIGSDFGLLHGSAMAMHEMTADEDLLLVALRQALNDRQPELQRLAYTALAYRLDSQAMDGLVAIAQGKKEAAVTRAEAVGLLGLIDPTPYYATIYTAYQSSKDENTRRTALSLLGGDREARADLISAIQNPAEPTSIRSAALGALCANDRNSLPSVAVPLLVQGAVTPDDLKIYAIKCVQAARSSPAYRHTSGRKRDDFDRAVQTIADRSGPGLGDVARSYIWETQLSAVP